MRSILAFCKSPLMNAIEAYIQFTPGLITDEGKVTEPTTEEFLRKHLREFCGSSSGSTRRSERSNRRRTQANSESTFRLLTHESSVTRRPCADHALRFARGVTELIRQRAFARSRRRAQPPDT